MSASPIATIGGSRDHRVPTALPIGAFTQQQMININTAAAKISLLKCFFNIFNSVR